jgi:uncharacterized protein YjgD (DUF1641 family)
MTAELEVIDLAERVDRMSAQMDFITAELMAQREARERWSEMAATLVPVTRGAMDVATRELDELSEDVTVEDLTRFARTLARSLPQMESMLAQLDSLAELMNTVTSLSGAGVGKLTETLAAADEKGYFAFAREGGKIADRVVTEFSEDDVRALGDNVVTILNAVKEMTQPEVMGLVQRTAVSVQDVEDTYIEPPSMFALLKSMRDPQTRRGLARVMAMLHTVGEQPEERK